MKRTLECGHCGLVMSMTEDEYEEHHARMHADCDDGEESPPPEHDHPHTLGELIAQVMGSVPSAPFTTDYDSTTPIH